MGITRLEIEVENPTYEYRNESVLGLLDTGATYSVIPSDLLYRIGIQPKGEQIFTLADGSTISREKGVALFRYSERVGGATVVFGEEDDSVLIGVTTLEALGMAFNPITRELYPLPMLLGSMSG